MHSHVMPFLPNLRGGQSPGNPLPVMYVGFQVCAGLRTETVASGEDASSYISGQLEFLASIANRPVVGAS